MIPTGGLPDVVVHEGLRPGELNLDPRGDTGLNVRFYEYTPTGADHIEIQLPGDKLCVIDRPAGEMDKMRFPQQWKAYEGGGAYEGQIRLETCAWADPALTRAMAREGIMTVEQLAALPDEVISRNSLLGLLRLRELAEKHLEHENNARASHELKDQNRVLADQVAKLKAQVQELVARPPASTSNPRGPRRKTA